MYNQPWGSSHVDETQALKYKQIDSLRQYFPTVKEVTREALYEVPVTLPSRKAITLRITLPPSFPKVAPILQIYPPVQHRLVDPQSFTVIPGAHENLGRWAVHASLGKTVYEIVAKLMQEPPTILPPPTSTPSTGQPSFNPPPPYSNPSSRGPLPYSNSSFSGGPPPYSNPPSTGGYTTPPSSSAQPSQQTHTPLPVIPSSFPEIESKSTAELTSLLNDETAFTKFFESLNAVQTMKKVRDDLRIANEDISKKTLALEAEVEQLKKDIASKMHTVNERRASFEQKAQRQQEVMKRFSTPALIEQLAEAAAHAEADSDEIATKFLQGQIDQKDFLRDFTEKRKLYHLRAAKKESLTMLTR